MKLEPPERANKTLNKAIQEINAKKRAAAIARDYGAITDTDGLVRIMGWIRADGRVSACTSTNCVENNIEPVDPEDTEDEDNADELGESGGMRVEV